MSDDDDFAALFEQSMTSKAGARGQLETGARVEVTVVQIGRDTVFVDAGTRAEGEIARHELEDDYGNLTVKVGDRLRVTVAQGGDRPKLATRFGGGGLAELEAAL